jgi:uncharacterized protein YutE (UPF0331/DUF86 family)
MNTLLKNFNKCPHFDQEIIDIMAEEMVENGLKEFAKEY